MSTQTKIIDAAFDLFCERGIRSTTTREIAASAGCNEVTLFRHFGNKEGVIRETIRSKSCAPEVTGMDMDPSQPVEVFLRNMIDRIRTTVKSMRPIVRLVIENSNHYPVLLETLNEVRMPMIERLRAYYTHQMETGNIRSMDPAIASALLFFPLMMTQAMSVPEKGGMLPPGVDVDELLDEHINMYLDYMLIQVETTKGSA